MKQEEPKTLRIMLLGKSGSGKSSCGNTILGRKEFKSEMKLDRVTKNCERAEGNINGTPVVVIDTPGLFLFDTARNQKDIMREILKRVKLQEPGMHVFVIVVPLGRMTLEDKETHTLIETMFGPRVWDYTIVMFTHGDRLEGGKTINNVISEYDANLRNFIRKCSGGFHLFDNMNQGNQQQVTDFLIKIETLMALNGGNLYPPSCYPVRERRIRVRQKCILAEKSEEIIRQELQLQALYKGDELKQKKKQMWTKLEEEARKEAEMSEIYLPYVGLIVTVVFLLILTILLGSYAMLFLAGIAAVAFVGLIKSDHLDKVLSSGLTSQRCVKLTPRRRRTTDALTTGAMVSKHSHLSEKGRVVVKLDGESKWGTAGTVQQPHTTPRSYLIQTDRGTLRRNRRHLRPTFLPVQQPDETESKQASEQPSSPLCSHPDSPVRETVPAEPGGQDQAQVTSSGRVIRPPDRFKTLYLTHS